MSCDAIKKIAQYAEIFEAEHKMMRRLIHGIVHILFYCAQSPTTLFMASGKMHVNTEWQRLFADKLMHTDRCYAHAQSEYCITRMDAALRTITPDQSDAGKTAARTCFKRQITSTIKELLGPRAIHDTLVIA